MRNELSKSVCRCGCAEDPERGWLGRPLTAARAFDEDGMVGCAVGIVARRPDRHEARLLLSPHATIKTVRSSGQLAPFYWSQRVLDLSSVPGMSAFFFTVRKSTTCKECGQSGLEAVYATRARAVHIGGEYQDNPFLSGLMAANRIRYYRRHHGPLATFFFRLSIVIGETMRAPVGPGHRAALRAALGL